MKQGKRPQSAMSERKKEDESKPTKLPPFADPQLFVTVEQANRKLKEIMKVTAPTEESYKSIQRITQVNEMMLRRQNQLRKLFEPSENLTKYLERIRQLVEELARTKLNELPKITKTIIPQLNSEVSGYIEVFERALAEKGEEIEALKVELKALKLKKEA